MNAWQLAEDFRAYLATASLFESVSKFRHAQDEQRLTDPGYPAAIVDCKTEPFSDLGDKAAFTLTIDLKTQGHDDTGSAHAAMVAEVAEWLFGHKSAVIAAVNALGNFTVLGYSAGADDLSREASAFSTPIVLRGTAKQL